MSKRISLFPPQAEGRRELIREPRQEVIPDERFFVDHLPEPPRAPSKMQSGKRLFIARAGLECISRKVEEARAIDTPDGLREAIIDIMDKADEVQILISITED